MRHKFGFDQGNYNLRCSPGGICATLTARWLKEMRTNKSAGPNNRRQVMEEVVRRGGPVIQQAYNKAWNSKTQVEVNNAFVLRTVAEAAVIETREWNTGLPSGTELRDYVKSHRRQGMHFNFGGKVGADRWGHAIGFWRSGRNTWHPSGHIYTFDPNFGEYKGGRKDFATWLPAFLNRRYRQGGMTIDWSYLLLVDDAAQHVTAPKFGVKVM